MIVAVSLFELALIIFLIIACFLLYRRGIAKGKKRYFGQTMTVREFIEELDGVSTARVVRIAPWALDGSKKTFCLVDVLATRKGSLLWNRIFRFDATAFSQEGSDPTLETLCSRASYMRYDSAAGMLYLQDAQGENVFELKG